MKEGVVVTGVVIVILGVLLSISGNNMIDKAPLNLISGGGYFGYKRA